MWDRSDCVRTEGEEDARQGLLELGCYGGEKKEGDGLGGNMHDHCWLLGG
jgi:hypothetical protein